MQLNDIGGILVTTTPQEVTTGNSRKVSLLHTGKADATGATSTAVIFVNHSNNIFPTDLYRAAEGYQWLPPNVFFTHHKKTNSFWVRTDSGTAILHVSPENIA